MLSEASSFKGGGFEHQVERLIRASKEKPLLPDKVIPWNDIITDDVLFMPEMLVSLQGHPLWDALSGEQQRELGRLEAVQVMYSYSWSETLACICFNRQLLKLNPTSVEYRFLLRESIEECRHQEMFSMAINKLQRTPVPPTFWHSLFGAIVTKFMPAPILFLDVIAVELLAEVYAKHIRIDQKVFSVIRETARLHHIEEARHIAYTAEWLKQYTESAGFFNKTLFSLTVASTIYFMRTLYVQQSFFSQLGVPNPKKYYRLAAKNHADKFSRLALEDIVKFVDSFNGFNFITRPFWRYFIKVSA